VHSDDGRRQSLVGIAQDVTERREAESRLNYLAHFDLLTGLPNRVLLRDRIGQAIVDASHGSARFAVVHVEIEEFSRFSASLGHAGGDQVLCAVATILRANARTGDTVSNPGGNAFVMLLNDIDGECAGLRRVQGVLQVFDGPIEVAGREVLITTRIGVSVHPADGENVDALLLHASAACARARELAMAYQFYTPRLHARAAARLDREVELYRALERDEFALHFQPRLDLVSNKATSVEALLRWHHPVHGMVQPSEFIPMLEDMGLILDVGRWVVRRACQATRMLPVTVSVNVSPIELRHPDFMTNILSVIEAEAFPAERLELEITEQALMHDEHETSVVLRELRAAGLLISIDDYGAGYSSLRYLKQLPLDYLKIDRLFVGPMSTDPTAAAIVRSTVDLCHDLGVSVVGEGAEDLETIAHLRTASCDSVQGFAIARPMPVDRLVDWLAAPLSIESEQS
jgi:diguanylate cyclase (GGDEF)-like protein